MHTEILSKEQKELFPFLKGINARFIWLEVLLLHCI